MLDGKERQDSQIELARSLLSSGRPAEAERICREGLALGAGHAALLELLGHSLIAQNRIDDALRVFQQGVRSNPGSASFQFHLGVAKQAAGRLDEAIENIEEATRLDPNLPYPHAKLGQLRVLKGDWAEAIPHIQQALKLIPNFAPALRFLATALIELGRTSEAEEVLARLFISSPDDPEALQLKGRLYQQQGDFDDAARMFEQAISLNPGLASAYVALAYSRKATRDSDTHSERMAQMAGSPELLMAERSLLQYALGKVNDDRENFAQAIEHFDEANNLCLEMRLLEGAPFNPEIYRATLRRIADFCEPDPEAKLSAQSDSDRPIFIVGMIRSGTTLVEQILAAHADIAAGGEMPFWLSRTSKGMDVASKISQTWIKQSVAEYEKLLNSISPDAKRVTDKMPINYQVLGAMLTAYPRARVIHCRRDPLDTCLSVFVTPYLVAPDFAHRREDIVFGYREYRRTMAHWQSAFPAAQILDVDYERLVGDTEAAVRELVAFIGLDWDPNCLHSHAASRRAVNTPSQWQVRQPVYQGSEGRWRNYEPWLGALRDVIES